MSKKIISQIDGLPVRDSGNWIKDKYHYLNQYCGIFTGAMKNRFHLTFVDLFAGPGKCQIRDSGEPPIDGSALIALGYDFHNYIFVEKDLENINALKKRCSHSPKKSSIRFIHDDCNSSIGQITKYIADDSLVLAFIDPAKINIEYSTIERLTSHGRVDLLMTIMDGMDIKRNFQEYKKKKDVSPLGRFLGGSVPWDQLTDAKEAIKFYKRRICKLGYKTVEFSDRPIYNTKNAKMYFLFFASKHPRGIDFWKKITKKDRHGQQDFFL